MMAMTEKRSNDIAHTFDVARFAAERLAFTPDSRQAELLATGGRNVILNCSRQWGKSTVTAAKAVHTAYFVEGSLILVAAPALRQSAELVRKAAGFLRCLGIAPKGDGDNEVSLALPNRSRIVGLPSVEYSVRGFSSAALLLIDEAARVDEDLYRALRPVLAVSGGNVWMMSTPFGKRGFFYETWTRGGPDWTRLRVPATECPRIAPAFLQAERKALGEPWFRQEYLCEFGDTQQAVFEEEAVRRMLRDDVEPLRF